MEVQLSGGPLRRFLNPGIPPFRRVLLIESGSRYLLERLLPNIYGTHPEIERVDILTCFSGVPEGFDASRGAIYYTPEWSGRQKRAELYHRLRTPGYDVGGMICSGEPIMTKWKWTIWWQVPAKYFLLNENNDYVWCHYPEWKTLRHFAVVRSGMSGANAITNFGRLLLFPFTLAYLLAYAAFVHTRRKLRT